MDRLRSLPADTTPPQMAEEIHRLVRTRTNNHNPYAQAKKDATKRAFALLPRLRERGRAAIDPLEPAVRTAIAGNIIDYGVAKAFELKATLERVLEQPFAIDGMAVLREALAEVDSVLYLADNAGEHESP